MVAQQVRQSVQGPGGAGRLHEDADGAGRVPFLASARMRCIKSPAWDLVWILNPLWLVPLALLLAYGHEDVRNSPLDVLFFVLTVPLWFGHCVSSAWLAYATPAYRPLLATQRLRFVAAPVAIAVTCFALLLAPESVLPMPVTERAVWFAVVVGGGFVVLANALAGSIAFQDRWIEPVLGAGALDAFARTLRDGSIV